MLILDTDHISVLRYPEHPRCGLLTARLQAAGEAATTVITWEEQLRGWLAEIKRSGKFDDQVLAYAQLVKVFDFFSRWQLLPFDGRAALRCGQLRQQRVRIGTQDLKIAAIALENEGVLLSANLRDFRKVPGLRVENWLA
jgi:tRNA(fMet)-specific endonuclease VapC